MEASDVVLLASGTATLEAMLLKRPMVVAYKLAWFSYWIMRILAKVSYISLPNLLMNKRIVPECIQQSAQPEILGKHVIDWLTNQEAVAGAEKDFSNLHIKLRNDANRNAAKHILKTIEDCQQHG